MKHRPQESLLPCSSAALPCLVLGVDQMWIQVLCLLWQLPGSGWLSRQRLAQDSVWAGEGLGCPTMTKTFCPTQFYFLSSAPSLPSPLRAIDWSLPISVGRRSRKPREGKGLASGPTACP